MNPGLAQAKWWHSNTKGKVGVITIMDIRVKAAIRKKKKSSNQNSLTHRDLWHWLADHGVPRSEIDGKPTKFLFDLFKQKSSRSSEQKSNLNHKNRESRPLSQSSDLIQFTNPEHL